MTSGKLSFSVPGRPRPKGRPRAVAKIRWPQGRGGEPEAYVQMVTPPDTKAGEAAIRAAFRRRHPDHRPLTGPVLLRFTAVFAIPSGWPKKLKEAARRGEVYHTARPDKDNVEKLIVDALNLVAWADDAQVQGGGVKRYGEPERLEVTLEPLGGADVPKTPSERRAEGRQAELALGAGSRPGEKPSKSNSPRVDPDLSGWSPRSRALIEAAMRRDDRTGRKA